MSCKVNFHLVRSALQNSVCLYKRHHCLQTLALLFKFVTSETKESFVAITNALLVGAFWERFFEKSKSGFPNPKTDHESIKSTLRVDSSDQIQIRIFEVRNLSVFFGKGFEKSIFDKPFFALCLTDAVHV